MFLAAACGEGGGSQTLAPLCVHEPALSWDNFGQGFMTQNCTPCHHSQLPPESRNGAPVGVDLDTYRGVITWRDRVATRSLGESPSMPPGGGIAADNLLLLEEWLGCQVAEDAAWLESGAARRGGP